MTRGDGALTTGATPVSTTDDSASAPRFGGLRPLFVNCT
jgi:hypothetical protein